MPDRRTLGVLVAATLGGIAAAAGTAALLLNVHERKEEGRNPYYRVVEITDDTTDPAVWGKNFPHQYESYLRTVDQVRTRFGGSEALPRTPEDADPRSVLAQSRLEEDPRLRTLWAGYAFSKDFREDRGHAWMLADQRYTGRQQAAKQPGTCIHCHASTYVAYKELGEGDLTAGFEALNAMPYVEATTHVDHPVACIDCHDPADMGLRVTRPAFMEGIRRAKAAEGIEDYDVNRDATRQELRAYVCGQCHVEYFFEGPEKRLVYPWHDGLEVEAIYGVYEENGHKDWVHADSGAPALKAQHPEFELWSQGPHARAGVTCADCHMPYTRVGAFKLSDHHVRSPLLDVNRACQTCHKVPEDELRARVEDIQERTFQLRNQAMDAVIDLVADLEAARAAGQPDTVLDPVRELQRQAQFYLDFIEAENSVGFHAPQEAARILGEAMNLARQGQVLLRDPAFVPSTRRGEPQVAAGEAG